MCKLITAIATTETGISKNAELPIRALCSTLKSEPDGMGVLRMSTEKKHTNVSSAYYANKENYSVGTGQISGLKVFAAHSRTATVGTVDDVNIHFNTYRGTYFGHNGHVGALIVKEKKTKYQAIGQGTGIIPNYHDDDEKDVPWFGRKWNHQKQKTETVVEKHMDSDSRLFHKLLMDMKFINKSTIAELMYNYYFSGCATFITKSHIYIMIQNHTKDVELRIIDNTIIVNSFVGVASQIPIKRTIMGIDYIERVEVAIPTAMKAADGVYEYKLC